MILHMTDRIHIPQCSTHSQRILILLMHDIELCACLFVDVIKLDFAFVCW